GRAGDAGRRQAQVDRALEEPLDLELGVVDDGRQLGVLVAVAAGLLRHLEAEIVALHVRADIDGRGDVALGDLPLIVEDEARLPELERAEGLVEVDGDAPGVGRARRHVRLDVDAGQAHLGLGRARATAGLAGPALVLDRIGLAARGPRIEPRR